MHHRDVPGAVPRETTTAYRAAGRHAARALPIAVEGRTRSRVCRRHADALRNGLKSAMAREADATTHQAWMAENARLLAAAERDARELLLTTQTYPTLEAGDTPQLRIVVLAQTYLALALPQDVHEATIAAFFHGVTDVLDIELGELWAIRPALMLALLGRTIESALADGAALPVTIGTIRRLTEVNWTSLFRDVSPVDRVLYADPAGAYARMDEESCDVYRHAVCDLARGAKRPEREVAEAALRLADAATNTETACGSPDGRWRRAHVGYYLVGEGRDVLERRIDYRPVGARRLTQWVMQHGTAFYLGGILLVTLVILALMPPDATNLLPWLVACLLLLVPATQAAVEFINALVPAVARPRVLPRLDFSKGLPADCETMVAVPALVIDEAHVRALVMDLEIRFLANRDPRLHFALLTDSVDAADATVATEEPLVPLLVSLVEGLNERYGEDGRTPFYLFHRHRVYNACEQRWIGWERKRGKLLDLNRLLRGGFDAFPIKVGDPSALPRIRYVITLDADTQLPRDSAQRLVGTIAHPLNRAVIDSASRRVVEGYGILQPRIGISTQSASRSWLARLLSGQTGFDLYTRAISDAYQDLFGEGIYTGKGIYDVDAFQTTVEHRFPENTLLSHDLIEGLFARVGLVTDVELIDDYPTHFSAYSRRKHRWMRGDWQILRWLMRRVPDAQHRLVPNPIGVIGRWKILDNLRRSLCEPATLALFLAGWFVLPGGPVFWTLLGVGMLVLPIYGSLAVAVARAPWFGTGFFRSLRASLSTFAQQHVRVGLNLALLLHDALLALDAIVRSLARVLVTRTRLLEWETAAQSDATAGTRRAADRYLDWSWMGALLIVGALVVLRPSALPSALPVLALWASAHPLASWLNRAPRMRPTPLAPADDAWLRTQAWRMWRYFADHSTAERRWLIPDHVYDDGRVDARLSPTNLGFLLNARVAAVHLGHITLPEFAADTRRTLDAVRELPSIRGHLPNWVDTTTGEALDPPFVSTVDSGNLAACIWTLRQAAIAFAQQPPSDDTLWSGIRDLAQLLSEMPHPGARALSDRVLRIDGDWRRALPHLHSLARHLLAELETRDDRSTDRQEVTWWVRQLVARTDRTQAWLGRGDDRELTAVLEGIAADAEQLVARMDFAFLYDARKKTLVVGHDERTGTRANGTYDLLASEARIASFVAIAKGDIPQESWFHLGRTHVASRGHRVLASWTGTMFEYLMPALWMRHYPRTILQDTLRAVVRLHQASTRARRIPWGISESGHVVDSEAAGGDTPATYGYAAFGLPALSLNPKRRRGLVIAPYASYLALLVDPHAAIRNLRHMASLGWQGRYGLYEAADYTGGPPTLVRTWMAHHVGMSLLSVCNLLCDHAIQQHFHAESHVQATDRLLHERVPSLAMADIEEWLVPPQPLTVETAGSDGRVSL